MKYINIINDINVSRISYGTSSLHHIFSSKDKLKILSQAFEMGITHFDTSPYYGNGISEYTLGRFSKKYRNQITITTKLGLYPSIKFQRNTLGLWTLKLASNIFPKINKPLINTSLKKAKESLKSSLLKLNSDHVDFLFLHEPNIIYYNTDEFLKWLEDEKKSGKIREYGICGLKKNIIPFLNYKSDFTKIIQTKDNTITKDADFLQEYSREMQFTYGYLSNSKKNVNITNIIKQALQRNSNGSIIFSTRKIKHLNQLVTILNSSSEF